MVDIDQMVYSSRQWHGPYWKPQPKNSFNDLYKSNLRALQPATIRVGPPPHGRNCSPIMRIDGYIDNAVITEIEGFLLKHTQVYRSAYSNGVMWAPPSYHLNHPNDCVFQLNPGLHVVCDITSESLEFRAVRNYNQNAHNPLNYYNPVP